MTEECERLRAALARAVAEQERLRAALARWGKHEAGCTEPDCSCGLQKAMERRYG